MKVLVCGGRNYDNYLELCKTMTTIHSNLPIDEVIHGGAKGADTLAGEWAEGAGIPVRVFKADWHKHGRSAGPIRNKQMLVEGKPDIVVAFPGGRGTQNMVNQAEKAGVKVFRV